MIKRKDVISIASDFTKFLIKNIDIMGTTAKKSGVPKWPSLNIEDHHILCSDAIKTVKRKFPFVILSRKIHIIEVKIQGMSVQYNANLYLPLKKRTKLIAIGKKIACCLVDIAKIIGTEAIKICFKLSFIIAL